jgi:hypothetical protein
MIVPFGFDSTCHVSPRPDIRNIAVAIFHPFTFKFRASAFDPQLAHRTYGEQATQLSDWFYFTSETALVNKKQGVFAVSSTVNQAP